MGKCEFALFCSFLRVFGRFLPAFCGNLVLFASMPCAYLYVNNFFPASLAWELRSLQRSPAEGPCGKGPFLTWGGRCGPRLAAASQGGRSPAREIAESAEKGGNRERATRKNCSAGPCAPRMSSNPTREGEPSRYTFRLRQELRRDKTPWQAGGKAGSGGRKCLSPVFPLKK